MRSLHRRASCRSREATRFPIPDFWRPRPAPGSSWRRPSSLPPVASQTCQAPSLSPRPKLISSILWTASPPLVVLAAKAAATTHQLSAFSVKALQASKQCKILRSCASSRWALWSAAEAKLAVACTVAAATPRSSTWGWPAARTRRTATP